MQKGKPVIVALMMMGLLAATGCEKDYLKQGMTESDSSQISNVETETKDNMEMAEETSPETITESVAVESVAEADQTQWKNHESNLGYEILYDPDVFEYTCSGGYDELVLKGKAFSARPLVFFAAMRIENSDIDDVVKAVYNEDALMVTIGKNKYEALSDPTEEVDKDGRKIKHNQFLVRLEDGDALLFEVQWYEDEEHKEYEDYFTHMLNSLLINDANGQQKSQIRKVFEHKNIETK